MLYPRPLTKYSNDRRRRKACRYVGDFCAVPINTPSFHYDHNPLDPGGYIIGD